jgi:hypothetical protein
MQSAFALGIRTFAKTRAHQPPPEGHPRWVAPGRAAADHVTRNCFMNENPSRYQLGIAGQENWSRSGWTRTAITAIALTPFMASLAIEAS